MITSLALILVHQNAVSKIPEALQKTFTETACPVVKKPKGTQYYVSSIKTWSKELVELSLGNRYEEPVEGKSRTPVNVKKTTLNWVYSFKPSDLFSVSNVNADGKASLFLFFLKKQIPVYHTVHFEDYKTKKYMVSDSKQTAERLMIQFGTLKDFDRFTKEFKAEFAKLNPNVKWELID